MTRRSTKGQAGFVITLELILIFTILGLGVMVGIVAIRNALFKYFLHKKSAEIYVVDSGTPQKILGKAFDLDEHEAPRLQFADLGPNRAGVTFGGITANRRVIVGVRDDRFTTRHRIYYQGSIDCGNTEPADNVCIVANGNEQGDNQGVGFVSSTGFDSLGGVLSATGRLFEAGGIGYLYPMQAGPSYGIGRDVDDASGLPGTLYRETDASCTSEIRSVWTSQRVVSGGACEPLPDGATIDAQKCPAGGATGDIGDPCPPGPPNQDALCVQSGTCVGGLDANQGCASDAECFSGDCNEANVSCKCPGTADGDPTTDWIDFGANCCPPGSTQGAIGKCVISTAGVFKVATPVLNDDGDNALSPYVPPFRVSVPVEISATFQGNEAGGFEGADPGSPILGDSDVDSVNYSSPPSGGEDGPP